MKTQKRTGVVTILMVLSLAVSACGSSNNDDPVGEQVPVTDPPANDPPANDPPANDPPANDPPANDPPANDPPANDPPANDPPANDPPANDPPANDPPVSPPSAPGADSSGGDDDSPTHTETLSLVGPFIKDPNRGAGPPSVPQGLTMLLTGENFVEFTWVPSTDDQSVEAYKIYRDGALVYTIRGDSGYEFDYRSWITTSYIDCNYTRYTNCENDQPASGSSHEYTIAAIDNEGMRSAQSPPFVFQLVNRQQSPVDLSSYQVVFSEEFNGSELDRNRWKTALPWGPDDVINGELQYFVNIFGNNPTGYDPFIFNGETLNITGINTPSDVLAQANNLPYLSGVISTSDYFKMTYGYVEMSGKLANGTGLLSTFYLFNQDFEKNKPEIDIIEYIGNRPNKAYQTYHYYDSNRARWATGERHSTPTMETNAGFNLSSGFHSYGVLWEEELVVWYIDGVEIRRLTGPRVSDEPMNIIAQLVMGSQWIGEPDAASIPASFEIDYIRAWQRN